METVAGDKGRDVHLTCPDGNKIMADSSVAKRRESAKRQYLSRFVDPIDIDFERIRVGLGRLRSGQGPVSVDMRRLRSAERSGSMLMLLEFGIICLVELRPLEFKQDGPFSRCLLKPEQDAAFTL